MKLSETQTFKPSQNLCPLILPQFKESQSVVLFDGFYSLDLVFNDKPYFICQKGNSYALGTGLEPSAIRGYLFKINDKTFVVKEHGVYHLESKQKFDITSIELFKEENVTITYHVSVVKYHNKTDKVDEILPKPYYSDYRDPPEQLWRVYAANHGIITVPDNCTGIDIEADQNCVFAIDGQQIIIGETERFTYLNKLTTLEYKGHFNINATSKEDRIITKDEKGKIFLDDLSITFFREGGEDEVSLDTTGIVGYFNMDADSLKNKEEKWYNKIAQSEDSTTSSYLTLQSVVSGDETLSPKFDGESLEQQVDRLATSLAKTFQKLFIQFLKKTKLVQITVSYLHLKLVKPQTVDLVFGKQTTLINQIVLLILHIFLVRRLMQNNSIAQLLQDTTLLIQKVKMELCSLQMEY